MKFPFSYQASEVRTAYGGILLLPLEAEPSRAAERMKNDCSPLILGSNAWRWSWVFQNCSFRLRGAAGEGVSWIRAAATGGIPRRESRAKAILDLTNCFLAALRPGWVSLSERRGGSVISWVEFMGLSIPFGWLAKLILYFFKEVSRTPRLGNLQSKESFASF